MEIQSSSAKSSGAVFAVATTLVSASFITLYFTRRSAADAKENENKYPPSPLARHWLWGHALALRPPPEQPRLSHDVIFQSWMHKLQSKVVMFQLPIVGRFIMVGDAEVARYVLHNKSFYKSPTYKAIMPIVGRKSIVVTEGEEWSAQRRLFNPGFSPDFLRDVVSAIVDKCDRFIAKCDEDVENGVPTDMLARAIDLTIDVIANIAFGEDWGAGQGHESKQTIRDLTATVSKTMSNPLMRFGLRHNWKLWRLSRALDRDMQQLVLRRLEKFRGLSVDDMKRQKDILSLSLSSVLQSKKNSESSQKVSFSNDEMENMTSQLKTFYFAGHDTTAIVIAWMFWLLVQHPKILNRVREEVTTCLGEDWVDEAKRGRKLSPTTFEKLQKCYLLEATVRETLRLYPPAASTRIATDSNASAGGFLLGNSIVHLNFYAIQRDPDIWEKPDEFNPERFLGDAGKKRIASSGFLPFSKGARDCIGKYFAILEAKISLAALICRYDGTVVDPNEVYATRLTSVPLGGCKVHLKRRSAV